MGVYRNVSLTFWTDPKIDDEFSPHEKYMYLYLLTNPHTNLCGCYQIARNQMIRETGLGWEEIRQLLTRMQDVHRVLRYNPETKEILLKNWGRYNWSRSPKVRDAVLLVAAHIRDPEMREFVLLAAKERWEAAPEPDKKESTKEKTDNRAQNTEDIDHKTDTVSSNRKYGYPMDRVSEQDAGAEAEGERQQVEAAFNMLWSAYPAKRRANRARCLEAFRAVTVPLGTLMDALERQKASGDWSREDGKYIPGLYKWITEERWEAASEPAEFSVGPSELAAIREMERQRGKRKKEED